LKVLTDISIVQQVLEGDTDAFGMLIDRYGSMVFQVVHRITGHREEAEDLSQEVFLRAFRQLSQFRGNAAFSSWLYRIAWNLSMDRLDKKRREAWIDIDELTDTHNRNFPSTEPYGTMDAAERKRALTAEIERLSAPDRLLIELYYREEKPVKEIAWIMGIGESNVKIRLHRIRKRLKSRFGVEENDELQPPKRL
jgi:RNA polymerase sigma-70 factor (ECF subfamily)